MRYTVTESFHTPLHRFEAGTEIEDSEIDGPVPVERWIEIGRLAPVQAEPAAVMQEAEPPAVVEAEPPEAASE